MDFTEEHRWNMDELKQERLAAAISQPDSGTEELWDWWTAMTSWWLQKNNWIFPWNKPSSYWGIAHSWKAPGPTRSGRCCLPSAKRFFWPRKRCRSSRPTTTWLFSEALWGTLSHWAQVNHGPTVTEKHEERQISGCANTTKKNTWVCLKIGYTPNYSHFNRDNDH